MGHVQEPTFLAAAVRLLHMPEDIVRAVVDVANLKEADAHYGMACAGSSAAFLRLVAAVAVFVYLGVDDAACCSQRHLKKPIQREQP